MEYVLGTTTIYKTTKAKPLFPFQRFTMYCAQVTSILAVLGVVEWAVQDDTSSRFLGGLASLSEFETWPDGLFNWHPVMMVSAFTFSTTQAIFTYRYSWILYCFGKLGQKAIHLLWHTITMGLMVFGLYATIKWHRLRDKAELYSLHSWLGVATVTMFSAQYLIAVWNFFAPGTRFETRRKYYPMHVFFGIFTYFLGNFTIATGIVEKNYELKCWYYLTWDTRDYDPAEHYTDIPLGCRYSNGVGVLVFVTIMLASYTAMDMKASIVKKSARRSSFLDIE